MRRLTRQRPAVAVTGLILCAAAVVWLSPRAGDAAKLLLAQNDPVALADARVAVMPNGNAAFRAEIAAAMAAGDADLAASFVALAEASGQPLPETLTTQVAAAVTAAASPVRQAANFASGFATGEADDVAGLAGIVAGDLFVFGDIRDVIREGGRVATGGEGDQLILGLAAAGLAVTAATYASAGAAAPVRAGLTLVKGARRAGRLSEPLARWGLRSARETVDLPALRHAAASGLPSARAIKAAFRADKAGGLVRFGKDVGRIAGKAGGRGAMDVLKVAQGPKEVARAARLAEARGGQLRALVKLFGRGALVLASGAFQLASWLFGLIWALLGMVVALKGIVEWLTRAWCSRRRRQRARQAPPALAIAA